MVKSWSRQQYEEELKKGRHMRYRGKLVLGPEGEEQAAFFKWLDLWTEKYPDLDLFHSIPNESKGRAHGAKLKLQGRKSGVPDTHLPVSSNRYEYTGLWIEFKDEGRKPDANQVNWAERLRKAGHFVATCYTWTQAANVTIDYTGYAIPRPEGE